MKNLKFIFYLVFAGIMISHSSCSSEDEDISLVDRRDAKVENRQYVHEDGPGWTPCEIANLKIFVPEKYIYE